MDNYRGFVSRLVQRTVNPLDYLGLKKSFVKKTNKLMLRTTAPRSRHCDESRNPELR